MDKTASFLKIQGIQFHKLNQINQKDYQIKINNKIFSYCKEQIILLSLNAFHHFQTSSNPF
jgi:hypothetical protein